jgi:uncharacterized membrane protein (DUF485 family)
MSETIAVAILAGLGTFILNVVFLSFYVGRYKDKVDTLKDEVRQNRSDILKLQVILAAYTGDSRF